MIFVYLFVCLFVGLLTVHGTGEEEEGERGGRRERRKEIEEKRRKKKSDRLE